MSLTSLSETLLRIGGAFQAFEEEPAERVANNTEAWDMLDRPAPIPEENEYGFRMGADEHERLVQEIAELRARCEQSEQRLVVMQHQHHQMSMLISLVEVMSSELELKTLLQKMIVSVVELLNGRQGAIGLVDEKRQAIRHQALYNLPVELFDVDFKEHVGISGQPLEFSEGATGELVATHLDRECVPLVRFRTRDHVVVWTEPCPCGRTGVRLRCIGPTDDMLILRGVNVFPSAIKDVVMSLRPRTTGEIQILLDQPGPRLEPPLKIQVEHALAVSDLAQLKREIETILRDKLIFKALVELVPPGTLPRYEMKAQLVQRLDDVQPG